MNNKTQKDFDMLSLQFLMNKTHYTQYLEKMKPSEFCAKKQKDVQFDKFRHKIQHLVNHYIKHHGDFAEYEKEGCIELQELFEQFIERALYYFQNVEDNKDDCENLFDIPTKHGHNDGDDSCGLGAGTHVGRSIFEDVEEVGCLGCIGNITLDEECELYGVMNEEEEDTDHVTNEDEECVDKITDTRAMLDIDLLLANRGGNSASNSYYHRNNMY